MTALNLTPIQDLVFNSILGKELQEMLIDGTPGRSEMFWMLKGWNAALKTHPERESSLGTKKLWITSWPTGKAVIVEILGDNPNIKGGIYIRKPNGGSDTTTDEFLFDVPEELS